MKRIYAAIEICIPYRQERTMKTMRRTIVCFLINAIIVCMPTFAVTKSWTGSGDKLWSNAANWSPSGMPQLGDSIQFMGSTAPCSLDVSSSVATISISAGYYGVFSFGPVKLSVTADVNFSSTGSLVFYGNDTVEFAGSGLQMFTPAGNVTNPDILHTGIGTVKLSANLNCKSFTQTAGSFDFNGFSLTTSGNVNVSNGSATSFVNLINATLTVGGNASFAGTTTSLIWLSGQSSFIIYMMNGGTLTANRAMIGNCSASGTISGGKGFATNSRAVSGYTPNSWQISGMSIEWTGVTDASWKNPANWTPSFVPADSDSVIFDTGIRDCMLDSTTGIKSVTFTNGYYGNFSFSINTLTVRGDADFRSGGTITPASGTLVFYPNGSVKKTFIPKQGATFPRIIATGIGGIGDTIEVKINPLTAGAFDKQYGVWLWGTFTGHHRLQSMKYSMSGAVDFGNCTLTVADTASFSVMSAISYSSGSLLELNKTGATQFLHPSWNGTLPPILHSGSATVTIDDTLKCDSYTQTAGGLDLAGRNLYIVNNLDISGGAASLADLTGRKIFVGKTAVFTGTTGDSINIAATGIVPCTLAVAGSLQAKKSVLKNCIASVNAGYALDSRDALGNTNWVFMPANTKKWVGSAINKNWSVANNWAPPGMPLSTDSVVFDNTSAKSCSLDVNGSVKSITFATGYTGSFSFGSSTLNVYEGGADFTNCGDIVPGSGAIAFNGSSAVTLIPHVNDTLPSIIAGTSGGTVSVGGTAPLVCGYLSLSGGVFNFSNGFKHNVLSISGTAGQLGFAYASVRVRGNVDLSHLAIASAAGDSLIFTGTGIQYFTPPSMGGQTGLALVQEGYGTTIVQTYGFGGTDVFVKAGKIDLGAGLVHQVSNVGATGGDIDFHSSTLQVSGNAMLNGFTNVIPSTGALVFDGTAGTQVFSPKIGYVHPSITVSTLDTVKLINAPFTTKMLAITQGVMNFSAIGNDTISDTLWLRGGTAFMNAGVVCCRNIFAVGGFLDFSSGGYLDKYGNGVVDLSGIAGITNGNTGWIGFTGTSGLATDFMPPPAHKMPEIMLNTKDTVRFNGALQTSQIALVNGKLLLTNGKTFVADSVNVLGGTVEFNSCTLNVATGKADLGSAVTVISGLGNILFSANMGIQQFVAKPGVNMPAITHAGAGALQLLLNNVLCNSFSQGNGSLLFNGVDMATVGDFTIHNGSSGSLGGLGGRTITVGGNAVFGGMGNNPLNCNPVSAWNLSVNNSNTFTYATIGHCNNTASKQWPVVTGCTDSGSNIKIDFEKPSSFVTFPANNSATNAVTHISGTARDSVSGLRQIMLTIKRSADGMFWNGTTWAAVPVWLVPSGLSTWTFSTSSASFSDGGYFLHVQTVDSAYNRDSSTYTQFVVKTTVPSSVSVSIIGNTGFTNTSIHQLACSAVGADSMRFKLDTLGWSIWEKYSTVKNNFSLFGNGEGLRHVFAQFKDTAGNIGATAVDSIVFDVTPPQNPSIVITDSNNFCKTVVPVIAISVTGADSMQFQVNAQNWTSWEPVLTVKSSLVISTGSEGLERVFAHFKDKAGNVSATVMDSTIYVTRFPQITSLSFMDNAGYTNQKKPKINIAAIATDSIRIARSQDSLAQWKLITSVDSIDISAGGEGVKTIFVQGKCVTGLLSQWMTASITWDTTPPQNPSITIVDNNGYTGSSTPQILLSATGADSMQLSLNGAAWMSSWGSFVSNVNNVDISAGGNGIKRMSARFKDKAGNISATVMDSTIYDTRLPGITSVVLNDTGGFTKNSKMVATVAAVNADSLRIALTNDTVVAKWTVFKMVDTVDISKNGVGKKQVWVQVKTAAGVLSSWIFAATVWDTIPPQSSILTKGIFASGIWPGMVAGTSHDSVSGVKFTYVNIQRVSDSTWWNGAAFVPAVFTFQLGGMASWSVLLPVLKPGLYRANCRSVDSAGNSQLISDTVYFTMLRDTIPPSPVSLLKIQMQTASSCMATWQSSTSPDADSIAACVSLVKTPVGRIPGLGGMISASQTSYSLVNLPENGSMLYVSLYVRDSAENWSAQTTDSIKLTDTVPPVNNCTIVLSPVKDTGVLVSVKVDTAQKDPTFLTIGYKSPQSMSYNYITPPFSYHDTSVVVPNMKQIGMWRGAVFCADAAGNKSLVKYDSLIIADISPPTMLFTGATKAFSDTFYSALLSVSDNDIGDSVSLVNMAVPSWMTFGTNGTLSGTPRVKDAGTDTLTIIIADRAGARDTLTRILSVVSVNNPPVLVAWKAPDSVSKDSTMKSPLSTYDPDAGDSLSVVWQLQPSWMKILSVTVSALNRTFIVGGTPLISDTGWNRFTLRVQDKSGAFFSLRDSVRVVRGYVVPVAHVNNQLTKIMNGAAQFVLTCGNTTDTTVRYDITLRSLSDTAFVKMLHGINGVVNLYPLADGQYEIQINAFDNHGDRDSIGVRDTFVIKGASTHRFSMALDTSVSPWQMVSFPGKAMSSSVSPLFAALLHWDEQSPEQDIYGYYRRVSDIGQVVQGCGYWRKASDTAAFTLPKVNFTDTEFQLVLNKGILGWNQIANPFPYPVAWPVQNILWQWNDSLQDFSADAGNVLMPWQGYWVQTDSTFVVPLKNVPVFTTASSAAKRNGAQYVDKGNWQIRVLLCGTAANDRENILGFSPLAKDDYDASDAAKPPRMTNSRYLYFSHSEWKRGNKEFAHDIRSSLKSTAAFLIGISPGSAKSKNTVMRFEGMENVPPETQFYLADVNSIVKIETGAAYAVPQSSDVLYKTLFVTNDNNFLKTFPRVFAMGLPYPNPVHKTLHLQYTLPYHLGQDGVSPVEPYHVKIAVYDVLGRQVNVITDDAKSPGIYNATWDVRAAAGTYFIKCSAGSYTSVKRMMIMR